MTPAVARARIEDDTQWQSTPVLTAVEVDRLLLRARLADVNGVVPDGDGYVETYTDLSVRAAIVAGWLMKAGKAQFDVKAGETEAKRSQMESICRRQAEAYAAGVTASRGGAGIGSVAVVSSMVR